MDFIPRSVRKFFAAGESILAQRPNPNRNHNLNLPKPITIKSRIMITNRNKIPRRKRINFRQSKLDEVKVNA
jgi:hypothetical protein